MLTLYWIKKTKVKGVTRRSQVKKDAYIKIEMVRQ